LKDRGLGAKIAVNLVLAAHSVSRTSTKEKKKLQVTDKCCSDEILFLGGMWDDVEIGEGGVGVKGRIPICLPGFVQLNTNNLKWSMRNEIQITSR
jgi:hypothetical protein